MSALLTQSPGDTVQILYGKVDPARKFKCTTAARVYFDHEKAHTKRLEIIVYLNISPMCKIYLYYFCGENSIPAQAEYPFCIKNIKESLTSAKADATLRMSTIANPTMFI